jgi:hypothetical protein
MRDNINRCFRSGQSFIMSTLLVLSALVAPRAKAQTQGSAGAPAARTGRGVCARGQPAPACRAFLLFEAGFYTPVHNTIRQGRSSTREVVSAFGNHGTWELGAMANVGHRSAVGATALLGAGGADSRRTGVRARYRYWLTDDRSIDVAAGPLWMVVRGGSEGKGMGATADLRLNFRDTYALTGRVDQVRSGDFATGHAAYAGVTLGSKAALVGTGVAIVLTILGIMVSGGGT